MHVSLAAPLQYYQDLFDQTIATRVIGGIIGSLLYLTLVVLVSSSGELLGGKGGSGWITVLFCTAAAAFAASAVCETSAAISVAASIPMTVYLQSASNFIHQR